jgi:hypothetical protein
MNEIIDQMIEEDYMDISQYHKQRIEEEADELFDDVKDVVEYMDNVEFSSDMDLAYLMGRISALKGLKLRLLAKN